MELRVAARAASVGRCRHWAAYMARTHGAAAAAVDTVELLTSELVTRAVQHGTGSVVVQFARVGDGLRVDVTHEGALPLDDDPSVLDADALPVPFARLGCTWGIAAGPSGSTTVWFVAPVHGAGARPAAPAVTTAEPLAV